MASFFLAHLHFYHSDPGAGRWVNRQFIWMHDQFPAYWPDWLKWGILFAPFILLLVFLVVRWSRSQVARDDE